MRSETSGTAMNVIGQHEDGVYSKLTARSRTLPTSKWLSSEVCLKVGRSGSNTCGQAHRPTSWRRTEKGLSKILKLISQTDCVTDCEGSMDYALGTRPWDKGGS